MGQLVNDVTNILDYKKSKSEAESERQKILAQIAEDEKAKSNLIKKALASQRAQYGAGGMSGKGMTEEAVLKRLREETEQPFEDKKRSNLDKLSKVKNPKNNILKTIVSRLDDLLA